MNIYIYGNNSFIKEIHATLDHANIKFKLDADTLIKEVTTLSELQDTIKNNPNDIYLIDDEKIIKKNSKIKFLNPKDGIEESFLLDHGIADLSVDSLADIPKYIIKRYEELKGVDEDIQNSIIDIVDEAYEIDNDEKFELDDELASLLATSDDEPETKDDLLSDLDDLMADDSNEIEKLDVNLDDLDKLLDIKELESNQLDEDFSDEEFSKLMSFDEDVGLNNITSDYDDEDNEESIDSFEEKNNEEDNLDELDDFLKELSNKNTLDLDIMDNEVLNNKPNNEEYSFEGGNMADEFSELDSLNESDILDALNGFDSQIETKPLVKSEKSSEALSITSSNVNDISQLISQLLQNKTLEITIKIKD